MTMKVLHVIPSVDPRGGGPIEGVTRLGEIMRANGVEQSLLTLDAPDSPALAEFCGKTPVHALGRPLRPGNGPVSRFVNWARYSPEAVAWGRENVHRYDAVVVNSLWNYATRAARQIVVGSGVPYVVYPHGMLDPWLRRRYPLKHWAKQVLWLFNEGVLLRNADSVLFTCEQEKLLARTSFRPYRVTERVVAYGAGEPPPADPAQEAAFRQAVPGLGSHRYLLYLSRIHEKKGCDLLVEAFARTADLDPGLHLVIAGPDEQGQVPNLAARAQKLGVGDRIHWPGMVRGAAKYGAYRGAEAFVLPSHQENFGIVVAEALACHCPVLISDQVNIWREIAGADVGLVEPDTLVGTENLLRRFAAIPAQERQAMGDRGRKLFEEKFTSEAAGQDLIALLRSLCGKTIPRPG